MGVNNFKTPRVRGVPLPDKNTVWTGTNRLPPPPYDDHGRSSAPIKHERQYENPQHNSLQNHPNDIPTVSAKPPGKIEPSSEKRKTSMFFDKGKEKDAKSSMTIKIGKAFARLGKLRLVINMDTADTQESMQRADLFTTLNQIEQKLEGTRGSIKTMGNKRTGEPAVSEAIDDIRDAVTDYQMGRIEATYRQNLKLIEQADVLVLNSCRRAHGAGYQHGNRSGCLRGTREAVLHEVDHWAKNFEKSPIFWLNGPAGTGKSTIAQTIAEKLFADGLLGASFFCSRGFEDRSNPQLIFPTLAFQLAQQYPEFRASLVTLLRSNPDITHESLRGQVEKLLIGPIRSANISTVIIIDALDECKEEDAESAMLLVLGQCAKAIPKVKFLVTSRPEIHIVAGFHSSLLSLSKIRPISHEIDGRTIDDDIRHYFKHELSKLAQRRGIEGWPTEERLNSLCQRAAGFFLFAVATVGFLDDCLQDPSDQLDTIMESRQSTAYEGETELKVYGSINSLYTSILQKSFRKNKSKDDGVARLVLSIVVFTPIPLSCSAIASLAGLACKQVQRLLEMIQSLLAMSVGPDAPIRLFHKSFSDFITDPTRCTDSRFYISAETHAELFLCCLRLIRKSLKKNMCSIPEYMFNSQVEDLPQRVAASGIRGPVEFACKFWYEHLIAGERQTSDVLSALRYFLEEKFIFWLEVLSVLGAMAIAVRALTAALQWLNQIQDSVGSDTLIDTLEDCLRFATEFFEVISQSAPHIYHSALPFTPHSSVVRKLYGKYIGSFVPKIVTDNPASWNFHTASAGANHTVYSPDGQLIAVGWQSKVELCNSSTLESLAILTPNGITTSIITPPSLAISPDRQLVARAYRVEAEWTSPVSTPGKIVVWDIQTGVVVCFINLDGDNLDDIAFSGTKTITIVMGGRIRIYNVMTGEQLWASELFLSHDNQLGIHWTHDGSLRFARSLLSDGKLTISICELQQTSSSLVSAVASFTVAPYDGKISFSPVSCHASFVTETEIVILNVQGSTTLLRTKEVSPLYTPPGCFSHDGCFFACGTVENEIYVWKNTPGGYVPRSTLRPLLSFIGFAFSPIATSILCRGSEGIELFHLESFASGTHIATIRQEEGISCRRVVAGPVKLLIPDTSPRDQGTGYDCDLRGCLRGTRRTILESIKSWTEDFNRPPILWLNGFIGAGKSAVMLTVMEWWNIRGHLGSSYFCSRATDHHGNLPLIIPSLAIQLAQQHPKVRSIVIPLLRSNPDVVYEPTSDQVEKLIVKPLKSADVPTLIVIDAFDEWMDEVSQTAFLSAIKDWIREIPKAKLLVTSWIKPHILAGFHPLLLSGLAEDSALHDIASGLVENDIRVFLERELSGLAAKRGLDNWPTATQLDLLRDRAAGLFVYAVATVKFLDHQLTSPDKQYAIIERYPDDTTHEGTVDGVHRGLSLDSLCLSIFQTSFRNNDAEDDAVLRSVLATAVLATCPLPPSAIAGLTCLEVEEVTSVFWPIQSLLRLEEDPDQPIHPFHKLLFDFLVSSTRCLDERFYIAPGKFHSEIALNCLKIMNEILDPEVEHPQGNTALDYACTSWYIHLAESREDVTPLIPTLRHFLEGKFSAWSRVLHTLRTPPDPRFALNETVSWIRKVADDEQLLSITQQCLLFI